MNQIIRIRMDTSKKFLRLHRVVADLELAHGGLPFRPRHFGALLSRELSTSHKPGYLGTLTMAALRPEADVSLPVENALSQRRASSTRGCQRWNFGWWCVDLT